jgi:hypothetical protein
MSTETFRTGYDWIELATQLLAFTKPGDVRPGLLPASLDAGRALALDMLRQVDLSDAQWLLAIHSPDPLEAEEYLIQAAVRGDSDALDMIESGTSQHLQARLQAAQAAYDANLD